jgi:hypothetical protein
VLVRVTLLLGATVAFWLLTAVPARALEGDLVDDALETSGNESGHVVEGATGRLLDGGAGSSVRSVDNVVAVGSTSVESVSGRPLHLDPEPARGHLRLVKGVVRTLAPTLGGVATILEPAMGAARNQLGLDLIGSAGPSSSGDDHADTALGGGDNDLPGLNVDPAMVRLAPTLPSATAHGRLTAARGVLRHAGAPAPDSCSSSGPSRWVSSGFTAFLLASAIFLGSGRWSRRDAEVRITPVFLSRSERPG